MRISVVIPTCNRKKNLIALLKNLNASTYKIEEVIVVDSGNEKLNNEDCALFDNLNIRCLSSVASVCIQRNIGIRAATSDRIFLCDDDIEVPDDYLQKIYEHILQHPDAGAVSGLVLQKEHDEWTAFYSIKSSKELLLKYIFGLSIWGKIEVESKNFFIKKIKQFYLRKGNFITKSGFPVITDFSGKYFIVPAFGLGASVIRKSWLELSPYDETLDRYGIGDNYGVAMGFPKKEIHVLKSASVYHHQAAVNRLDLPLQYYRRMLALEYFIQTEKTLKHVKEKFLLWALFGNMLIYFFNKDKLMTVAAYKTFVQVLMKKNPYAAGVSENKKMIEPSL